LEDQKLTITFLYFYLQMSIAVVVVLAVLTVMVRVEGGDTQVNEVCLGLLEGILGDLDLDVDLGNVEGK
jgi:TctA family transporter